MSRSTRCSIIAFALALGLWGGIAGVGRAAAPAPLLRIVHASSDAPAIDAYVNGQKVTTAPHFAAVTPYTTVAAGVFTLQVMAAGAGPGGTTFVNTIVNLREGAAYTIVVADKVKNMVPVVLDDTLGAAADGQARVRLIHVSPDAPPVADVAIAGGAVVARNLPFKGATGYLAVAPGTYAFEIRPAGTAQALATTPPLALEADRSYSAFVMGQLGDGTFRAVIAQDNAATGGVASVPSTGAGGMFQTGIAGAAFAGDLLVMMAAASAVFIYGRVERRLFGVNPPFNIERRATPPRGHTRGSAH